MAGDAGGARGCDASSEGGLNFMAKMERIRDASFELIERRVREGWKLAAVEWVREIEGQEPARQEIPYGLRVSEDCRYLEEDPEERRAMLLMMELVVQDVRISDIAHQLNERGFRTRGGAAWTPPDVFQLLPRLIEAGQKTFATDEWAGIRRGLFKRVG